MSDRGPRRPPDRAEPEVILRLLRLDAGQAITIRTLASRYAGIFVHWAKGKPRYCPGPDKCEFHRIEQQWRGYTPVEAWDQAAHLWIPWVFEISEALDLDFRDVFGRGQVWEVRKGVQVKKTQKPAMRGKLLEERPEATFPPPFDMRPVLCSVYHVLEVRCDQTNPMPGRVKLKPSQDAGPGETANVPRPGPSVKEVLNRNANFLETFGKMPEEPSNGKSAGS